MSKRTIMLLAGLVIIAALSASVVARQERVATTTAPTPTATPSSAASPTASSAASATPAPTASPVDDSRGRGKDADDHDDDRGGLY